MRIKRLIDFFGAIFLLLLNAYHYYYALVIKITDGGPIFTNKEEQDSWHSFNVIKFRSMCINSEKTEQLGI